MSQGRALVATDVSDKKTKFPIMEFINTEADVIDQYKDFIGSLQQIKNLQDVTLEQKNTLDEVIKMFQNIVDNAPIKGQAIDSEISPEKNKQRREKKELEAEQRKRNPQYQSSPTQLPEDEKILAIVQELATHLSSPAYTRYMEAHVPFIRMQDSMSKLAGELGKNSAVANFLNEKYKGEGVNALQSRLILPVQRLPRYELLLKEIIKQIPQTRDKTILENVVKTTNTFVFNTQQKPMLPNLLSGEFSQLLEEAIKTKNKTLSTQLQKWKKTFDSLPFERMGEIHTRLLDQNNEINFKELTESEKSLYQFLHISKEEQKELPAETAKELEPLLKRVESNLLDIVFYEKLLERTREEQKLFNEMVAFNSQTPFMEASTIKKMNDAFSQQIKLYEAKIEKVKSEKNENLNLLKEKQAGKATVFQSIEESKKQVKQLQEKTHQLQTKIEDIKRRPTSTFKLHELTQATGIVRRLAGKWDEAVEKPQPPKQQTVPQTSSSIQTGTAPAHVRMQKEPQSAPLAGRVAPPVPSRANRGAIAPPLPPRPVRSTAQSTTQIFATTAQNRLQGTTQIPLPVPSREKKPSLQNSSAPTVQSTRTSQAARFTATTLQRRETIRQAPRKDRKTQYQEVVSRAPLMQERLLELREILNRIETTKAKLKALDESYKSMGDLREANTKFSPQRIVASVRGRQKKLAKKELLSTKEMTGQNLKKLKEDLDRQRTLLRKELAEDKQKLKKLDEELTERRRAHITDPKIGMDSSIKLREANAPAMDKVNLFIENMKRELEDLSNELQEKLIDCQSNPKKKLECEGALKKINKLQNEIANIEKQYEHAEQVKTAQERQNQGLTAQQKLNDMKAIVKEAKLGNNRLLRDVHDGFVICHQAIEKDFEDRLKKTNRGIKTPLKPDLRLVSKEDNMERVNTKLHNAKSEHERKVDLLILRGDLVAKKEGKKNNQLLKDYQEALNDPLDIIVGHLNRPNPELTEAINKINNTLNNKTSSIPKETRDFLKDIRKDLVQLKKDLDKEMKKEATKARTVEKETKTIGAFCTIERKGDRPVVEDKPAQSAGSTPPKTLPSPPKNRGLGH